MSNALYDEAVHALMRALRDHAVGDVGEAMAELSAVERIVRAWKQQLHRQHARGHRMPDAATGDGITMDELSALAARRRRER